MPQFRSIFSPQRRRPGRLSRRPAAFTLVELLVVISIVSLLVALTLPNMRRSREAAKNTICLSNLRQTGIAFTSFRDDNRDRMPAGCTQQWYFGQGTFYDTHLLAYTTEDSFFCPSMDVDVAAVGAFDQNRGYGYSNAFCYHQGSWSAGLYTSLPVPVYQVRQPAATIVLGDRNLALWVGTWAGGDLWYNFAEDYDNPVSYESNGWTMRRHGNWLNFLFLDTHATGMHVRDTYIPDSLWDFN